MKFTIPGFPTEVSERIELPDIAEILRWPFFRNAHIEDVYKHGSAFQRHILDKMPLRNDRKYVTVLSTVHLLMPRFRSLTQGTCVSRDSEWHIDGTGDNFGDGDRTFLDGSELVHMIQSDCNATTEFNRDPFEIELQDNAHRMDLCHYLTGNFHKLPIVAQPMEAEKIVTFSNHMHRAPEPTRPEFRFLIRVRETNKTEPPSDYKNSCIGSVYAWNIDTQRYEKNIERQGTKVVIHFPY